MLSYSPKWLIISYTFPVLKYPISYYALAKNTASYFTKKIKAINKEISLWLPNLPFHVFLCSHILPSFPLQWMNCPFVYLRPTPLLLSCIPFLKPTLRILLLLLSVLNCCFPVYWIIPITIQKLFSLLCWKAKQKLSLDITSPSFLCSTLYPKSCLFLVFLLPLSILC